ncbi:MAG: sigma-70 family RNA polymerase sigma factor [Planctomycetota bacterium]|nr:sigma-70 family RNA polymerase sigma factor [Planctomycetota bacterium]
MVSPPSTSGSRPVPGDDEWLPAVYEELRRLAHREMRREHEPQTLQTTALVHEAYLKLSGDGTSVWRDRAHFFGAAARAMRQVLVDHARARHAEKRGGGVARVPLESLEFPDLQRDPERMLALEDALQRLEQVDERKAKVVSLRYFAGLSIAETAGVLELSVTTVKDEWSFARAWLFRELRKGEEEAP